MRLIIVSGLSGSGKSVALHVLEDLGYYCVDNLPVALLKSAIAEVAGSDETGSPMLAVGVDARSRQADLDALPELIEELRRQGTETELLFLQSDDDVLLKRYGESRRRHALRLSAGKRLPGRAEWQGMGGSEERHTGGRGARNLSRRRDGTRTEALARPV